VTVTVAQLRERIDETILVQLTDPNNSAVDEKKLEHALADAAGQIAGYTFTLAASDIPPEATLDAYQTSLALYALAGNRPGTEFDSIRARAKMAIDYLDGLSKRASVGIDVESSGTAQISDTDLNLFSKGSPS
jgi:phage gp36-like protein